jgi:hypothetical protein
VTTASADAGTTTPSDGTGAAGGVAMSDTVPETRAAAAHADRCGARRRGNHHDTWTTS